MKKTGAWFMGSNRRAVLLGLVVVVIAAAAALMNFAPWSTPAHAQAQESLQISGPFYSQAVKFDVSPPLRSMRVITTPGQKADDDEIEALPNVIYRHEPDPVLQTTVGTGVFTSEIPSPIISFDGQSNPNACGGCAPPDTNGDVGPNHYVQMVNLKFQMFDKTGTSLFGPANTNTLWQGFGGPCQTENAGDPVVIYDQLADRWLLTQFTDTTAPFFNCVAISQTGDPTGAYYRYAFSAPVFPDYPHYGVWPDAYYINTNEGGNVGNYALDRTQMIAGNPAAGMVRFGIAQPVPGFVTGMLPGDVEGTLLPPAGAPEIFIGTRDNDAGAPSDAVTLYRFHVDFGTPGNSTFTGPELLTAAPVDTIMGSCNTNRLCIPQPGTAQRIDHLGYRQRPTFRAGYRKFPDGHDAIVTSQSVDGGVFNGAPMAGMRWYEVRDLFGTPTMFQQGTFAPGVTDGIHRWMGSIAMDKNGNMGLGYSVSSDTATGVFPGIRYTGRLESDPLGTMPQGEATLIDGGGVQTTSLARWGDYSDMTVDPVDDCTFWYTQEYYATTSAANWKTRIGSFKFPNCVQGTPSPSPTPSPFTPSPSPTRTPTPTPTPSPSPSPTCIPGALVQNFDGVTPPALPAGWTSTGQTAWVTSNSGVPAPPADSPPNAAFAPDPDTINDDKLDSPTFTYTAGAQLTFRQNYDLEESSATVAFDNGLLEISTDNGATFNDIVLAGGAFVTGGYNHTSISTGFQNPCFVQYGASKPSWSGLSGGFQTATVTLPAAGAGQSTRLRWRMCSDNSVSHDGWRVDSVVVSGTGGCGTPSPGVTPSVVPSPSPSCAPAAWVAGPAQPPARALFQGAMGSDGKFYVAGGQDLTGASVNTEVARYNATSNAWESVAPLPVGTGQVSVGATGGKVFVAGGYISPPPPGVITNVLRIYDIATNTWSTGANMPAAKEAAAGVALNGKFYVIGGDDGANGVNTNFIYDIATDTWSTGAPLPAIRTNTVATAAGGMVYVFGGSDITNAVDTLLRYDPATNTWTNLGSAGTGGQGNYGGVSPYGSGQLLITAGSTGAFVPGNTTRIFTISSGTFSAGPNLLANRSGHAQGTLPDGRVIVADGFDTNSTMVSTVELLGGPCVNPTPTPVVTPSVAPTRTPTPTPNPSVTPSVGGTPSPSPSPGQLTMQFSSATYTEDESQTAVITVTRTVVPAGPGTTSTVNYATSDGTATGGAACAANVDYISTSGTLTFNPGETSKTFNVTLCPDSLVEANETVNLTLSNPTGGSLGTPSTAVLTINDTANEFRNGTCIDMTLGAPAVPYPSEITVTGGPQQIGALRVTLFDVTHQFPDNIDVLLEGPQGQKFVLMGDAGGPNPLTTPATLTFIDTAGQVLPNNGPLVTGNFEPTNWETPVTSFPPPAPPAPYNEPGSAVGGTGLQTLNGNFMFANANGTWRLWVRDDAGSVLDPNVVIGSICGWGIQFLQTTAAGVSLSGRVMTAEGAGIRNARVVVTGNSLPEPRVATTGSFGYFTFDGLTAGETYVVTVNSQRYTFQVPSRVYTLVDNIVDADFTANP